VAPPKVASHTQVTERVPVIAAPDAVTAKVVAAPVIAKRSRPSTLPPGIVEKLDDEWDAPAPAAAEPVAAAPVPASPEPAPTAPAAEGTGEAVDDGWE
jgi:hypothetical protein